MSDNVKIPSIIFKPIGKSQAPVMSQKIEKLSFNISPPSNVPKTRQLVSYTQYHGPPPAPASTSCEPKSADYFNIKKGLGVVTWAWIIVIPIVIFVLLVAIAPTYIENDNDNDQQINWGAVIIWTILISLILYVSLFAFNGCRAFDE